MRAAHNFRFEVLKVQNFRPPLYCDVTENMLAVAYQEGGFGVFKPSPRNSKDIGGDLDRISKKNRRLDFHL